MTSIKFRALTHDDHKLFFEALGEFGKDFQNIQQYMAQKCGKTAGRSTDQSRSNDSHEKRDQDKKDEDKKREQIRNFYNKLYTKLSQLIDKLDDRVEKVNQELYLLINYGEIWKKHGFKFNNKTRKLLEELVHQGYTTLRFKNKNVRLRTPPCKALKKINEIGIDEKVKVVTTRDLPKDVVVEFLPATNRDWLKVQSMSQNPRVRARLSIQKRLSTLLEFLENKWNISKDKLNRTVDAWLKVPSHNPSIEDSHQLNQKFSSNNTPPINDCTGINRQEQNAGNISLEQTLSADTQRRLRLRPSSNHELKEINITRVVPDSHLDLSLNAYISRLGNLVKKRTEPINKTANKDTLINVPAYEGLISFSENQDHPQNASSSNSRLPISLTTPDSSILLERSVTSDQPIIAQTRKHLNILQSIAGSFEGCENSRTACEDTQDRTILPTSISDPSPTFSDRVISFDANAVGLSSERLNYNSIPELYDEDAAIDTASNLQPSQKKLSSIETCPELVTQQNSDSQNSKSVDFHIPKNLTLGDWFKMNGQGGEGDEANDSYPVSANTETREDTENFIEHIEGKKDETEVDSCKALKMELNSAVNPLKPHNHMIEMQKLAQGWTRQDETSMTIGEIYLAFKCPEKIVLEYEFEQFIFHNQGEKSNSQTSAVESLDNKIQPTHTAYSTTQVNDNLSNNALIFKLLTAASLSLAHLNRQKQEQQSKLLEQPNVKLKRRKGPMNPNTIKYLKRDEVSNNNNSLRALSSGVNLDGGGNTVGLTSNHKQDNNNYVILSNDKIQDQGQTMTLHDIETRNQRVEEALKQLQPTRLSVFRRTR